MYLNDSKLLTVSYVPIDYPVHDFEGVDVGGHAGSSKRGAGARGANAGDDDEGIGPTRAGVDGERHRHC
jgi:hypothetical protein